jgi:hypothetical protein
MKRTQIGKKLELKRTTIIVALNHSHLERVGGGNGHWGGGQLTGGCECACDRSRQCQ